MAKFFMDLWGEKQHSSVYHILIGTLRFVGVVVTGIKAQVCHRIFKDL